MKFEESEAIKNWCSSLET